MTDQFHRRAALMLGLAASFGLGGCQPKPTTPPPQQARGAVSVVAIQWRPIAGGIVASGQLTPREDIAIFPQVTGYRVARVLADVGQTVAAGQPLAVLDDTLLRAQLAQQQALAQQQSVMAAEAESQAQRVAGLDNQGLLSREQIETRRYAARSARAQAAAAAAAVRDLQTREALMVVRAPRAGLVIERNVRVGDMSGGATTPFYRLAQDSRIELAADVGEDALAKLRPGDTATVTLADDQTVPGAVRLVTPAVDPTTKLGKVRISLPVRRDIVAGGFARASFAGGGRAVLAVPETAVRYDANGASVMVVGPDNRLTRAPVATGERGGGWVELVTGPPAGARVVEKAAAMFVPGDMIIPAPPS